MIINFVASYDVCLKRKEENMAYPGELQPLPIPNQAWSHISLYFIEGFPKSRNKKVILVVVDRMTKYAHFIDLSYPYTTTTMADVFWKRVHCLHGTPESIATDKDREFLSNFWQSLFRLLGIQLHYSITYYP